MYIDAPDHDVEPPEPRRYPGVNGEYEEDEDEDEDEDDRWTIFCTIHNADGKPWKFVIAGGTEGEGPAYYVGIIEGKELADDVCAAHNAKLIDGRYKP